MKPLVAVPLRYGAIAGVFGIVVVLGLYYLGRHPFLFEVYADFRIFLFGVFIFFTLKELRDIYYRGVLYFWEGIIASFLFTTIFAIVASAGIAIFSSAVPDFVTSYVSLSMERIKSLPPDVIARIGKDVYERNLEMLPATNAFDLALLYCVQCFMIGFFISIILSVILRRQPKT
jgi:hypothetical protein